MSEGRQIVVGVDGSPGADHALRWALSEGRIRDAEVVALLAWGYLDQHPAPGVEGFDPEYGAETARAALDAFLDRAVGENAASITRSVVNDLPARALLDAAQNSDLLVVGARGLGGFRGLLLGSVSQRCVHLATMPLVVVRAHVQDSAGGRIVVGVDGSEASGLALRWAVNEGQLRRSGVTVFHAWQGWLGPLGAADAATGDESARRLVDELVDGLDADKPSSPIERVVVRGGAAEALVDASKTADLLVVGNHGRGELGGLLVGSVAQQVAHHSQCPVALIPARHAL